LIVRDNEGKPYSVRYDQVNAMLLNEFLKEHKKVEKQAREIREQKAAIKWLGKRVETVIARIEEHESKTRRVNEQNEVDRFATKRNHRGGTMPQLVGND
jgi:Lhr-like helicase